jgi:hypothetical protein
VLSGLSLSHTEAEFNSANDSLIAALIVTLICIAIGDLSQFLLFHLHNNNKATFAESVHRFCGTF